MNLTNTATPVKATKATEVKLNLSISRLLVEARFVKISQPKFMLLEIIHDLGDKASIKEIRKAMIDMAGGNEKFYGYGGMTSMLRVMETKRLLISDKVGTEKAYMLTTYAKRTINVIRLNATI